MPRIEGKENVKISLRHNGITEKTEALFYTLLNGRFLRKGWRKGARISHKASLDGSFTLEAALSLPIFLFAVGMVLYLFVIMQVQYIVGNALDQAVAETALLREASESKVKNLAKAAFYEEIINQNCPISCIKLGIAGFSWQNTEVDESHIQAQVTYQVSFPFGYFGKQKVTLSNRCRMRRWSGNQGGNGSSKKQEWVYITPTDTVYHRTRVCTHLKLSIRSVSSANQKELKKYAACGHCTKGQKKGTIVYITEEGDCYHYAVNCSGLKRTIYMVPKKETNGRPACLRCGGK